MSVLGDGVVMGRPIGSSSKIISNVDFLEITNVVEVTGRAVSPKELDASKSVCCPTCSKDILVTRTTSELQCTCSATVHVPEIKPIRILCPSCKKMNLVDPSMQRQPRHVALSCGACQYIFHLPKQPVESTGGRGVPQEDTVGEFLANNAQISAPLKMQFGTQGEAVRAICPHCNVPNQVNHEFAHMPRSLAIRCGQCGSGFYMPQQPRNNANADNGG